jgi:hypothetical protein
VTDLLQQAISAVRGLPDEVQDAIAARLLEEVADEQAWSTLFAATADDQWAALARMAGESVRSGGTVALDESFPDSP